MPVVVFEDPTGTVHSLTGATGSTVMSVAVKNGIQGILAECGGSLACASCHVYVDAAWIDKAGRAADRDDDLEDEMLDSAAAERRPTSRLSCQLVLADDLDGLRVKIPDIQ